MAEVDPVSFESMISVLNGAVSLKGDKSAFCFINDDGLEEEISYSELQSESIKIAVYLQQRCVVGDRAILIYPPGLELIKVYFACLYAGVVAVPVYPPTNDKLVDKLQLILDDCSPSLILSSKQIINRVKKLNIIKKGLNTPLIGKIIQKYFSKMEKLADWEFNSLEWFVTDDLPKLSMDMEYCPFEIKQSTVAFIQYTSGSTGNPKGVVVSHGNLLDNLSMMKEITGGSHTSIGLFWLPPYHDLGLIAGILGTIYLGCFTILMSPIKFINDPISWLTAITKFKATFTAVPNFAFDLCVNKMTESVKRKLDLSSLEYLLNGAEPINLDSLERFQQIFSSTGLKPNVISPGYGLAEATLMVSGTHFKSHYKRKLLNKASLYKKILEYKDEPDLDTQAVISCGLLHQDTIIVDPSNLELKTNNEIGEIWLSGKSVALGYWNNNPLTKDVFEAKYKGQKNKEKCYLRSGDLGFIDESNHLYIVGRIKDIMIIKGRNFYPQDIEKVVNEADPLIRPGTCAAFAIEKDGTGQLVVSVEVQPNYEDKRLPSVLATIGNAILVHFQVIPYAINLIKAKTALKTTSGKIRRQASKDAYLQYKLNIIKDINLKELDDDYSHENLVARLRSLTLSKRKETLLSELKKLVASLLLIEDYQKIDIEKGFFELGLTSLLTVELQHRIQLLAGDTCVLSKTLLFEYNTIKKLSVYLQSHIFPSFFSESDEDMLKQLDSLLEENS